MLRIKFLGANARPRAYGLEELAGKSNYLVGRDPSRWRTNVPSYTRVMYEGVYPGVDVVYYGTLRQLEYDFNVEAGADAGLIRMRVEGARRLRIDRNGDLVLPTAAGEVRQRAPHAYQEIGGVRRTVSCRYVLRGAGQVGFELGAYERSLPLVIDPVVSYSTFLGGGGSDDGTSIAVDAQGNAYVTGYATSWDFPVTPNALQPTRRGGAPHQMVLDAFVTKLSADGTALVYSTYLGGDGYDSATSIAVDDEGQAHVAGETDSTDFPTTPGAFRAAGAGSQDVFVAKLDAAGASLLYSTYLGGSDHEGGAQLALGSNGEIYVGGQTRSSDYHITPGAFQLEPGAVAPYATDGFVTKLLASPGAGPAFSTYLGGSGNDFVAGLAVARGLDDSVYVTGSTLSPNFPTTPNALQGALAGDGTAGDLFVTRLNPAGTAALFSTYLGGAGEDVGTAVAVDAAGAAYVAGHTYSDSFPTTPGVFQAGRPNGGAVVAKLSADGGSLLYSTYFGGTGGDKANAIAVDTHGNAYVAGETNSVDLPVTPDALRTAYGGSFFDGFLFKLSPSGRLVPYATYVGGADWDVARDVAVGAGGQVYLTGVTSSSDFNVTFNAFQPYRGDGGWSDAFVTRLVLDQQEFTVSGQVKNQYGIGLRDAEVGLRVNGVDRVVLTDDEGFYTVSGLPRGAEVMVWASRFGFNFFPLGATFSSLERDETVIFTGSAPLRISGRVVDEYGMGLLVPIRLVSDTGTTESFTDYDGSYSFIVPADGNYTVTPGPDPERVFTPPSHTFGGLIGDQTLDFTAQWAPRIQGRVVDNEYGYGLGGVRVTLSSPSLAEPRVETTDDYGFFYFEDLERGASYTVTAVDPVTNRSFEPAAYQIPDIQTQQFITIKALRPLAIHGYVSDPQSGGISGVATLTGTVNAEVEVDQWGYFNFMNLPRGGDYTVTPSYPLYTFTPPSRSVSDLQADQILGFEALPPLRISGGVADENGIGLAGATVTLTGAASATTQTDEWGIYHFNDLPRGGTYFVTPAHELYTFTPPSREVPALDANQVVGFDGVRRRFTLGGRVADAAGAALPGVTMTLGGASGGAAQTDANGNYAFTNLAVGRGYTVTAERPGYTFTPASFSAADPRGDTTADFTATLLTHNINGRVVDANGNGFAGAAVQLIGTRTGLVITDANGNYSFDSLPAGGDYTVEPSREFYDFSPVRAGYLDLGSDQTANFTAALRTFSVGGRVTEGANGVAGVTVNLSGSQTASTQTDAAGNYLFTSLPANGTYAVTPAHPFYSFSPGGASFNTLPFNQTASFAATRLLHQVSGYALDPCGRALPGVTMTLTHDGVTAGALTDAAGFYSFAGVQAGYDYALAPAGSAYAFSPPSILFPALNANQAGNFTGTPPAATVDAPALADLYVRGGNNAGTNFGAATQLISRLASQASNSYETYVKFDAGRPCTVSAVRLRLYGQLSSNATLPVAVYGVSSTAWTEGGTTWNNRPAAGTLLRTVNVAGTTAGWYEWDVTDYVRAEIAAGRSIVSFVLKPTATTNYQATFSSREAAGTNAPRLAITTP